MSKILLLATLICFISCSGAQAMDWQALHDQAGNLTLAAAQEAVAKSPGSTVNQYVLGLVYLNLHRDREAGEIFSKLLLGNPDLLEAKWGKAEVLRRQHAISASEELLNAVIKTKPEFAPALISLAYIKYFQMDFKASVNLALRVIEQGRFRVDLSNYVRAYAMYAGAKGMLAHYGGLISKAVDGLAVKPNLDKAQKLQPDSAAVSFGLGSFYLLAPAIAGGDKAQAEHYLYQAIKADPYFADVYVRLGQLARIKGDQEKYKFYLQKAMEIDPQNELAQDVSSGRCNFICPGPQD
jgi:tetratricopeptide (TPR) repeat protein